jgi:hypothetical protein
MLNVFQNQLLTMSKVLEILFDITIDRLCTLEHGGGGVP